MRAVSALLLLATFSGCGLLGLSDDEDTVQLFTDRDAYALGDTAQVWFRNGAREPATLSLCEGFLERRVGSSWLPVPNERGCALILLAPSAESVVGRHVVLREFVEADVFTEGTYRFNGTVALGEGEGIVERRLASRSFSLSE